MTDPDAYYDEHFARRADAALSEIANARLIVTFTVAVSGGLLASALASATSNGPAENLALMCFVGCSILTLYVLFVLPAVGMVKSASAPLLQLRAAAAMRAAEAELVASDATVATIFHFVISLACWVASLISLF